MASGGHHARKEAGMRHSASQCDATARNASARPGTWNLTESANWRASPRGRTARLIRRWYRRIFGRVGAVAGIAILAGCGYASSALSGHHSTAHLASDAGWIALAALCYLFVSLILHALPDMIDEALGSAALAALVAFAVVSLPLLLIPAYRRWLGRAFRDQPRRAAPDVQAAPAGAAAADAESRWR